MEDGGAGGGGGCSGCELSTLTSSHADLKSGE